MVKGILLGLLALVALGIAAAVIWYLQLTAPVEVSNAPPAAPTLVTDATPQAGSTATAAGAASRAARVYRIDPSQSQAAYRVDETFFDVRGLVTVTGTTRGVSGDILVDQANLANSTIGEIVVDISQLRTDEPSRDNAIRRGWLESSRFPLATFKNGSLSNLPAEWTQREPFTFKVIGDLTIRDVTSRTTWNAQAAIDGDTISATATTPIKMTQFGFDPPRLLDLQVEDDVTLMLTFVAEVADTATPSPQTRGTSNCLPTLGAQGPGGAIPTPPSPEPPARPSVGTGHILRGAVRSSADCSPIPNAKMIFWLTNPQGIYDEDHRSTIYTDSNGEYTFESNFPGAYDDMPPHIHFFVSAEGYTGVMPEYLPDKGQRGGLFDVVLAPEKK